MTAKDKLSAISTLVATDGSLMTDSEVVDGVLAILGEKTDSIKIEIDLTDDDVHNFYNVTDRNQTIDWTYKANDGTNVDVEFISQDEWEQRSV